MAVTLTPKDFEKVGQLAAHCDNVKLQIAINEAIKFDMRKIFCDLWNDIEENWDSADPKWTDLINGAPYLGCRDKERRHYGVKEALIYFAYSRYIVINGFNDTASGHVQKTNNFSMPKPLKELHSFATKYKNMAFDTIEGIKDFLCRADETDYPNYDRVECGGCGCYGECSGAKSTTRTFGLKSKTISKWDA